MQEVCCYDIVFIVRNEQVLPYDTIWYHTAHFTGNNTFTVVLLTLEYTFDIALFVYIGYYIYEIKVWKMCPFPISNITLFLLVALLLARHTKPAKITLKMLERAHMLWTFTSVIDGSVCERLALTTLGCVDWCMSLFKVKLSFS